MRKILAVFALLALLSVLLAGPAAAQTARADEGLLIRIGGNATVEDNDHHGAVVVIDGNLDFAGTAETIVIIEGFADLTGATVEELIVVSGEANLGSGTVISGDVHLVDSVLNQDSTATVEGTISQGAGDELADGFWALGLLFTAGLAVLAILAGLVLAGVAPALARRAGRTITSDLGLTILAGLVLWIVAPIIGGILFATLIGIPSAVTIWLVVLPMLWFVGFLVSGTRIGEYITSQSTGTGHPYLATFVGVLGLVVVGLLPFVGPLIGSIAGFLGSGALALHAYRAVRNQHQHQPPAPAPMPTVAEEAIAEATP